MSWCFCPLSSVFLLLPSLEIFRPFHARFIPIIGMDQTINKLMYSLHDLCHGLHYFPGGLLQRPLQVCNLFRTHEHSVISKVITQSLITQLSSLNVFDQIYVFASMLLFMFETKTRLQAVQYQSCFMLLGWLALVTAMVSNRSVYQSNQNIW